MRPENPSEFLQTILQTAEPNALYKGKMAKVVVRLLDRSFSPVIGIDLSEFWTTRTPVIFVLDEDNEVQLSRIYPKEEFATLDGAKGDRNILRNHGALEYLKNQGIIE